MNKGVKILRVLMTAAVFGAGCYILIEALTADWEQQSIEEMGNDSGYQSSDYSDGYNYSDNSRYSQGNSYNSYSRSTAKEFHTAHSVMTYLCSRKFYNEEKNITMEIRSNGIYANGQCITGAVSVIEYAGTQAVVSATSPYTGGRVTFLVDTEYGCIANDTDGAFVEK